MVGLRPREEKKRLETRGESGGAVASEFQTLRAANTHDPPAADLQSLTADG